MKKDVVGVENRFMFEVVCAHCRGKNVAPQVVCMHCHHILQFYTMNPFVIFQSSPNLPVNLEDKDNLYFAFQRQLHPDKLGHLSDAEKLCAERHISQINDAYKALKRPISSGKAAVLYIKDITTPLERFNDRDIPQPEIEFLQSIMALQLTPTQDAISAIYADVISDLNKAVTSLSSDKILKAIARLTYVDRLQALT